MSLGFAAIDRDEAARIVAVLEAGGRPPGLEPAAVIGGLVREALGGDGSEGPSLVRQAPRRPGLRPAIEEPALAAMFPRAARPARLALAAGLLQIHDFWDASHEAAQEADDLGEARHSAYWHAIAHRREPDPSNAMYWFRRVRRHAVYAELARVAPEHTDRDGAWDPGAFVAACTRARKGSAEESSCRRVQRFEMECLLAETLKVVL